MPYPRRESHTVRAVALVAALRVAQAAAGPVQEDKSRLYNSKPHTTNPKFQPLDETLRRYIADDEKHIAHWSELGHQHSAQARKLEAKAQQ